MKGLKTWYSTVLLVVQLQLIFEQLSSLRYAVKSKFTVKTLLNLPALICLTNILYNEV